MVRTVVFFVFFAAVAQATPPTLLDELRQTFDTSPEKLKAKLACKQAWSQMPQRNAKDKPYTMHLCAASDAQIMVDGGVVFGVAKPLRRNVAFQIADAAEKDARRSLAAAGCKLTLDRNQLAVYDCPGAFAVAVTSNWNSKTDDHTVSVLFGPAASLLPALGLPTK
jgi:hypothetical protein